LSAANTKPAQTRREINGGYTLVGVQSHEVPFHIEAVEPLIQEACDRTGGLIDASHLLFSCLKAECQLWLVTDANGLVAAIVTEIRTHPRKKALHVIAVGGKGMSKWASCLLEIESWAESLGCEVVSGDARPGWIKEAKKLGYRAAASVFHKELNPVRESDGQDPRRH